MGPLSAVARRWRYFKEITELRAWAEIISVNRILTWRVRRASNWSVNTAMEKKKHAHDTILKVCEVEPPKFHKHIRLRSQKEKLIDNQFQVTSEQKSKGLKSYYGKTYVETFKPHFELRSIVTTGGWGMKLRRTKHAGWYEVMTDCPICGHKGWCRINDEQTIVHCMRVPSDDYFDSIIGRQFRHYLDPNAVPKTKVEIEVNKAVDKKPDHHLNRVYRALMSELPLSSHHLAHLRHERKINENVIRLREYRTMPTQERYKIAKSVINRLSDQSDLLGVPGFFCAEGRFGPYWTMAGGTGLMVPFRSITNEITGWQIRVDDPPLELAMKGAIKGEILEELDQDTGGMRRARCQLQIQEKKLIVELTEKGKKVSHAESGQFVFSIELKQGQRYWWWSSGSKDNGASIGGPIPFHLALPHPCLKYWQVGQTADTIMDCSEVWVTEGPIKADKAADGLVKPVFGIPGAGAFSLLLEPLKQLGCKRIVFAYDADVVNTPEVEMALEQCVSFFAKETDMAISLALWDISHGKGIDDLIDKNLIPQVSALLE